ncbi:MAG: tRNA glutamyl-Q(34) synthetase GluQRS [Alphaproteobacteria bacterium]|nr:tRNA glutamyl-Q(34) synthetase GluQRS [Alphaproteobacteria bacterium]
METITRFAPSPTGYLHLGHAYSALINLDRAQAANGRFLLRIEDIDQTRCRPEYDAAIFEDLAWLGLTWEEPVVRQSERMAMYETRLADLQSRGLIYRCFKTRKDIENALSAPHNSLAGAFRSAPLAALEERDNLADGKPYAWRLSLTEAAQTLGNAYSTLTFTEEKDGGRVETPADVDRFGDVVLGRKDSGTSYHLSSVLDDAEQGVTHIIRGEDLREAAGLHTLLYALFDLAPPLYRHHALITGEDGKRLAKRDQAATLRAMREGGLTPDDVKGQLP